MTVLHRGKPLRDWLVSAEEAARAVYVSQQRFRALSADGFIQPASRKGFFRLGDVIDGYAEAVRLGAVIAPHARASAPDRMRILMDEGDYPPQFEEDATRA